MKINKNNVEMTQKHKHKNISHRFSSSNESKIHAI